jgi:FkbM family methyltransferase
MICKGQIVFYLDAILRACLPFRLMFIQPIPGLTPRRLAFYRLLLHIRPAPVAALFKRLFGIRRHILETPVGRLWIDPASDFGFRLLTGKEYAPDLTAAFRQLLKPGDTCVDIGANEGWFSILAGRLTGDTGRVLAVEPQNRLKPVLATNFDLNGLSRIRVDPSAVSASTGKAYLFLSSSRNSGASGLFHPARVRLPFQTVPTCTLRDLLDRHGFDRVTLMKIDIEGHEHEAILGSPEVFTSGRVAHLALEIHPTLLERLGRHPGAIKAFLSEAGYGPNPAFPGLIYSRLKP